MVRLVGSVVRSADGGWLDLSLWSRDGGAGREERGDDGTIGFLFLEGSLSYEPDWTGLASGGFGLFGC
jgi:hypothetical protein